MFRKISFPPLTMDQDRQMLRDGMVNAGIDMSKAGEWFGPLYDVLQKHILDSCKGDKSLPNSNATIDYFRVGPAVVTDENQLPKDVWDATGGFIVAMQDVWGSRNWIFPHDNGSVINDDTDEMAL